MAKTGTTLRTDLSKWGDVLDAVSTGPLTKPELVATVGASRSTIDRAVTAFVDHGCLEPVGSGAYRVTNTGRAALDAHEQYVTRTDTLCDAAELLNQTELALDFDFICGAEVYLANPQVPELALEPSIELISNATRFVGLASTVLASYPEVLCTLLEDEELDIELVGSDTIFELAVELDEAMMSRLLTAEAVEIRLTDRPIPEALWIAESPDETYAGVTIHAEGGIKGTLVNNTPAAVEWAREMYATFREDSEQLSDGLV